MDSTKEKLILDNMYLADRFAGKFRKKLPKNISFEELQSAAYMGLVRATKNYKTDESFPKYACFHIRGEILDYVRKLDNYRRKNKIKFGSIDAENSYGQSIASNIPDNSVEIPDSDDFFLNVRKIVTERQYEAVENYYINSLGLAETASRMKISASAVSKLLDTARMKIRKHIKENKNNRFSFAYNLI